MSITAKVRIVESLELHTTLTPEQANGNISGKSSRNVQREYLPSCEQKPDENYADSVKAG